MPSSMSRLRWKGTRGSLMDDQISSSDLRNLPLQALPERARRRFLAQLTPVTMPVKKVLFEPAEEVTHVYFPVSGVISLVTPLEDGNIVEVAREQATRDVVQTYTQALFSQIAQAAACNRLHSNEERLSRWLLMSHDRVGRDVFDITHEFLGQMLGSRRATVTLSMGVLQAAGLIRYHRGRVTILDREELQAVSCECYGVIQAAFDRNNVASHNGHAAS
jgi:CRP-like cAMP-binding protein